MNAETDSEAFVTIVSGLPRSGTSMMMRMLEAGGMPVLADGIREADDDNLRGYYEYEAVKQTGDDASWLEAATGHGVKMVYRLLYDLPDTWNYRVLIMRRDMDEVLKSQKTMLRRKGIEDDPMPDEKMKKLFEKQLAEFYDWIDQQPNFSWIDVNYNMIVNDPRELASTINEYLGSHLDTEAMCSVVEPKLYRNRA